ncbi:MAG TPA: DUF2461 domain-containing protein [Candidatus Krumholzibacteria bacterium]|nr:DUF2461 domain-containing protein [Candidatus Krumholzibacteria bacterium]HPD72199.1 DUF2461 domain-containing protein [Candidatus Krumholzibacteria bacterium]HRY40869.1 DUF2461 domain-containing protein [Candidatus Krumholzibacteria bacterium]
MARPYFTPALFAFLEDLAAHNDRDWFQRNRDRYEEHVKTPALRFIVDFGPHLRAVSPHFDADPRPSGGSLFRIHRDVRFSADKSPYKTHAGIHFRHENGRDAHAPGFYVHLEPRGCLAAAGVWQPDAPALSRIREAIAARPARWQAVLDDPGVASLERFGEQLQRVPAGYAKDHPQAGELRWKEYGVWRSLTHRDVLAADALERVATVFRRSAPFVKFLCEALGQPF